MLDGEGLKWSWYVYSEERDMAQEWLDANINIAEEHGGNAPERYAYYFDFQVLRPPRLLRIHCPHWLGVVFCVCLSFVPWLPWRFSLRTLLIATTLLAVVLGLIVAVLRWAAD
jgi:hypothetical protein